MLRFKIAALASVLVIGAVGAGLTAASAATVAHVQDKVTKAEQSLANHVPQSFVTTCVGETAKLRGVYARSFPKVKKQTKSIVAAITCSPTGASPPDTVVYTQWKNVADMNALYQAAVADFNIQPNSGAQATCPFESTSTVGGTPVGRAVCQPALPGLSAEIYWTTDSLKIMGDALLKTDPDGSLLTTWWKGDSGPNK